MFSKKSTRGQDFCKYIINDPGNSGLDPQYNATVVDALKLGATPPGIVAAEARRHDADARRVDFAARGMVP